MVKEKKLFTMILLFIFVFNVSNAVVNVSDTNEPVNNPRFRPVAESPITIVGDDDFDTQAVGTWDGAGTEGDPYNITGVTIDGDDAHLISITDTSVYFVIHDCTLINSGVTYNGIWFDNVSHGAIIDCEISNNGHYGIDMDRSDNITIYDSVFIGNKYDGIHATYSDDLTITYNWIEDNANGIDLRDSSDDNYIAYNDIENCSRGIWIYNNGQRNNIYLNSIRDGRDDGIYISSSDDNTIQYNEILNCDEYGIQVFLGSEDNFIHDNKIYSSGKDGIFLDDSDSNTLSYNEIYENNYGGIYLVDSHNNDIDNNDIYDNTQRGIRMDYSDDNTVESNTIDNNRDGCYLYDSQSTTFNLNTITDNREDGIDIRGDSKLSIITNNTIDYNDVQGISLNDANNTFIANNSISYSGSNGILVFETHDCRIESNHIAENEYFGVDLDTATNVNISKNNFCSNNPFGTSQLRDNNDVHDNRYKDNLYDDFFWHDYNNDGMGVDMSYIIDNVGHPNPILEAGSKTKLYPIVDHYLIPFDAITPNGGEDLGGNVTIQIYPVYLIGTPEHSILYSIEYSPDNGNTWILEADGLTKDDFDLFEGYSQVHFAKYYWDTTNAPNSTDYRIRVNGTCSAGLVRSIISDTTFTVYNDAPIVDGVTVPTIITPQYGGEFSGSLTLEWNAATDSLGHDISYEVSYSPNDGTDWFVIASDLATTSYIWNTTTVPDGDDYRIKVNASCTEGIWATNVSRITFTIDNINHELSIPVAITPTYDATVSGSLTVNWTTVVDTEGHTVYYTVILTNTTYTLVIDEGITETSVILDTTSLADGWYGIRIDVNCSIGSVESHYLFHFEIVNTEETTSESSTEESTTEDTTTDTTTPDTTEESTDETTVEETTTDEPTNGSSPSLTFGLMMLSLIILVRKRK